MNARTRTLLATALVLGVAAGPEVAHAAPAPAPAAVAAAGSAVRSAEGPIVASPPDAAALQQALSGVGAQHEDATAALVRVGGTSGSWRGSAGVADIRTGREAIEQGRFRAGSVTKTFTAAVVLQLAAEGKVDLNRPVQQYLPGLLPDTFRPVAVRHLLNYTSGIKSPDGPDTFEEEYAQRFDVLDPREMIANAVAKGPESEPGEKQHYQNINYTILGVLIEELTGQSYEKAVGDRVLKPLGLHHTSFPGRHRTGIPGPHNRGYQAVGDGLVDVTEWNSSSRWAAGDIISTTADLERFTVALFSGCVVPKPQLEEMFTVPDVKDFTTGKPAQLTAGMSRIVLPDGTEAWGKSGGRYGYNTGMGATRDLSRTLVYSVNSTDAKGPGMNPVALRIVQAAFKR
ncbi:serine hydrolase domain-containing protein [Streptomyces bambusae]|uniref:Serine hydrolase n=1 Tax=Streptomyces bambusae TaxID=1550616 RepID=A0ABS6Z5Z3_9ACTN|nr:serine hydrolase domain-containing protein [Streptomyces bambusae]MBW5482814.1 serine hydrolase [Streptomyces bambusae]